MLTGHRQVQTPYSLHTTNTTNKKKKKTSMGVCHPVMQILQMSMKSTDFGEIFEFLLKQRGVTFISSIKSRCFMFCSSGFMPESTGCPLNPQISLTLADLGVEMTVNSVDSDFEIYRFPAKSIKPTPNLHQIYKRPNKKPYIQ